MITFPEVDDHVASNLRHVVAGQIPKPFDLGNGRKVELFRFVQGVEIGHAIVADGPFEDEFFRSRPTNQSVIVVPASQHLSVLTFGAAGFSPSATLAMAREGSGVDLIVYPTLSACCFWSSPIQSPPSLPSGAGIRTGGSYS